MLKRLLFVALSTLAIGTPSLAHHSYAAYDREHKVSLTGQLEQVTIANPHSMLVLRTDEGTAFSVEWGTAYQLARGGFTPGMLAVGDRVTVTGSQAWDAAAHRMALVTSITRPLDGWRWSRDGVSLPPRVR